MAVTAEAAAEMVLERRAYARVGLLGNPSDVYGGRALSFAIADFSATVHLRPSPELLIQPHPHHDLVAFPSLPQLSSVSQLTKHRAGGATVTDGPRRKAKEEKRKDVWTGLG
ncbi:glucuronokinase 1-like [Zea mays]|uniref:Uncharacterized protein n=1 Tax=Zea mays TaxID=4577 RepID=B6TTM1_MAIZE|nr:glucuronokinase 1-like [Zea mays]ACG40454.1 hypothetical protein [Zea mays]|eukprot:NP_001288383.1 glucuronokinase 1-like [Zea mays]